MPKVTAALTALLLAVVLTGCGDDQTPSAEPAPFAASAQSETPEDAAKDAAESTPEPVELTPEDEAFLQYVEDEKPPASLLEEYSDAELVALGHDSCDVVRQGTPWEDIRMVEGEEPNTGGYYLDSSAVLNGALYNYCPELIPDVG